MFYHSLLLSRLHKHSRAQAERDEGPECRSIGNVPEAPANSQNSDSKVKQYIPVSLLHNFGRLFSSGALLPSCLPWVTPPFCHTGPQMSTTPVPMQSCCWIHPQRGVGNTAHLHMLGDVEIQLQPRSPGTWQSNKYRQKPLAI